MLERYLKYSFCCFYWVAPLTHDWRGVMGPQCWFKICRGSRSPKRSRTTGMSDIIKLRSAELRDIKLLPPMTPRQTSHSDLYLSLPGGVAGWGGLFARVWRGAIRGPPLSRQQSQSLLRLKRADTRTHTRKQKQEILTSKKLKGSKFFFFTFWPKEKWNDSEKKTTRG